MGALLPPAVKSTLFKGRSAVSNQPPVAFPFRHKQWSTYISGGANDLGGTAAHNWWFMQNCQTIRLLFCNTAYNGTNTNNGNIEYLTGLSTLSVQASVISTPTGSPSTLSNATPIQATFYGGQSLTATIPPGGYAISDPVPVYGTRYNEFLTRTFVQVPAGGQFPMGSESQGWAAGNGITGLNNWTVDSTSVLANNYAQYSGGRSNFNATTTAATAAGNAVLTFASAGFTTVGIGVSGANIPAGSVVTAVSGGSITISNAVTGSGVATGATISFAGNNGCNQILTPNEYWPGCYNGKAYGPDAILASPSNSSNVAAVALIGDSRIAGLGDPTELGYAMRALWNGGIGGHMLAKSGDQAQKFVQSLQASSWRLRLLEGATHGICNYGINDVTNGQTLAQIQANLLTIGTQCANLGIPLYQTTIDPHTNSTTNSWSSIGVQTYAAVPAYSLPIIQNESVRQALNVWIRALMPIVAGAAVAVGTSGAILAGQPGHPFAGVFDTAAVVEANSSNVLTLNGGYWYCGVANNTAFTLDGVHTSQTGSIAQAAVINTSLFTTS